MNNRNWSRVFNIVYLFVCMLLAIIWAIKGYQSTIIPTAITFVGIFWIISEIDALDTKIEAYVRLYDLEHQIDSMNTEIEGKTE